VFPGAATEAHIAVPTKRTNAQIRSDGSCGPLQVGMVVVIGDGIRVTDPQWVTWSSQLASAVALGPVSSQAFATQTVSLTLDELGVGTRSLYLGANRGRGQLYPDGSLSNLTLRKAEVSSICTGVSYLVKRYGSVVHLVHGSGVKLVHLLPGQAVEPVVGPRMLSQVDTLLGRTLNLGGFGLGEVALSIQSPDNLKRFLSLMVLLQITQLLLLNKKKQYERLYL
jgi:apocytochrome f